MMAIKITNRIVSVTRRWFLSGTAGAISGAVLLPNGEAQAEMSELEQMAHALHQVVGQYSDQSAPFFAVQPSARQMDHSLNFAMENLRYCSVDEIQRMLKSFFEGGAS